MRLQSFYLLKNWAASNCIDLHWDPVGPVLTLWPKLHILQLLVDPDAKVIVSYGVYLDER